METSNINTKLWTARMRVGASLKVGLTVRNASNVEESRRIFGPTVLAQVDDLTDSPFNASQRDGPRTARQVAQVGFLLT